MAMTVRLRRGVEVRSKITAEDPQRVSWATFLGFDGMDADLGDDDSGIEPPANIAWGESSSKDEDDSIKKEEEEEASKPKADTTKNSISARKRALASTNVASRKKRARPNKNSHIPVVTPSKRQSIGPTMASFPSFYNPFFGQTMAPPFMPAWNQQQLAAPFAFQNPQFTSPPVAQQPQNNVGVQGVAATANNFLPGTSRKLFSPPRATPPPGTVLIENKKDVYVLTEGDKPEYILVDPLSGRNGFISAHEAKLVLGIYYKGETVVGPINHQGDPSKTSLFLSGANRRVFSCIRLHGRWWLKEDKAGNNGSQNTAIDVNVPAVAQPPSVAPTRVQTAPTTPAAQSTNHPTPAAPLVSPHVPQNCLSQSTVAANDVALRKDVQPVSDSTQTTTEAAKQNSPNPSPPAAAQQKPSPAPPAAGPQVLATPPPGVVIKKWRNGREEVGVLTDQQNGIFKPVHPLCRMIGFASHQQARVAAQNYYRNGDFLGIRVHDKGSEGSLVECFDLFSPSATKSFRSVLLHGRFWLVDVVSDDATKQNSNTDKPPVPTPPQGAPVQAPSIVPSKPSPPPQQPLKPKWKFRDLTEDEIKMLQAAMPILLRPLHGCNGRAGFGKAGYAKSALLKYRYGDSVDRPQNHVPSGHPIEYFVVEKASSDACSNSNDNVDSAKDKTIFRTVEQNGRYWVEEICFEGRK